MEGATIHPGASADRFGADCVVVSRQRVDLKKYTTIFTTLELRTGFQLTPTLRAEGITGWRHAFGDVDLSPTFTLAGSTPFAIHAAPSPATSWRAARGWR